MTTIPPDRRLFGTAAYPLRPSGLSSLNCSLRSALMFDDPQENSVGEAAETGSILHAMVQQWYLGGVAALTDSFRAATSAEFPKGSPADAAKMFEAYAADARNDPGLIYRCELPVKLVLPCATGDVVINGTADQVRRVNGRLELWDVKTGKISGWSMIHSYAYQLAAYTLAASATLGAEVHPGGLILTRAYLTKANAGNLQPPGVFFSAPFTIDGAKALLKSVVAAVEDVRAGRERPSPGENCSYCPYAGLRCLSGR